MVYIKKLYISAVISTILAVNAHADNQCLSQNKMLGLVSGGTIKSIGSVWDMIELDGEKSIVNVKLCQNGDTYFYNVQYWENTGKLATVTINAETGVLIKDAIL